ncbi:periaxin isoform X2 [Mixophyes fleayi]|uniref:periaxin isoform X2 n=1 Tax=Mixophyes fleayi TaxID=3061075 RepID=UPI003F4E2B12
MCDCFHQIFGVSWSPSSSYGEERLESHVSGKPSETSPVKERFSPLKQRSPPAGRPHLSPEEIKDADRAVQKEKLHAELKKVLLQKGQRNLAEQEEPKMETTINITEEKLRASEMVEVIVETEAQAGMTGINICGGGKDGLFISDVLKDSPAFKTLPLLEGDQIISAKVYFENIKYEDALKILQCAEQYKVGYCLKRTVPSSDVTLTPGSAEVKCPKAKMPKMTVKSLTPVKKKKKKVPSQVSDSEASLEAVKGSEISATSMDIPAVDVEFSFPKFSKFLKTKGGAEDTAVTKTTEISTKVTAAEQKRPKMKFPRLRVKEAAAAGGVSLGVSETKAVPAKAGAEVEGKDKSAAKTKKLKADVTVSKPQIGVSLPKVGIEAKEEKVFKTPQVELDIPLPTIKAETPEVSESVKVPGICTSVKIPDVEIKVPLADVAVEAPGAKFSIPQISRVGICAPQLQKEPDLAVHVDGRPKTEIKLPSVEIAAPKVDVNLSLPKVDGSVEVETPETTGQGFQIKLPKFSMSSKAPEPVLELTPPKVKKDIKEKVSEDKFKMPSIKTPQIGISLPKGKIEGDSPDGQPRGAIKFPSLDISAPKVDFDINVPKLESGDITVEPIDVPDVLLKMPKISPPRVGMKAKDAYPGTVPHVDTESPVEIPDVTLKMPKIGLPKLGLKGDTQEVQAEGAAGKSEGKEFKLKGPKINLPSFGIRLSKDKSEMDGSEREYSKEVEGKLKFPSIKMPSVDISLPKVQDSEPGKLEVTVPSTKTDIKASELEGTDGYDLKFKMPKVSLPKLDVTAKLPKIGDLTVKDDKISVPELDISVPKIKPVDLRITSPKSDLGISLDKPKLAMKLPKVESDSIAFDGDSKVSLPSIKMPTLDIDAPSLGINLNFPKVKTEASQPLLEEADTKFQMPTLNLPKLSDVAKNMNVELDVPKITGDISLPHIAAEMKGPGLSKDDKEVKMSLPKVEIGVGKSTYMEASGSELKEKADVRPPKVKLEKPDLEDIKLPSVKLPSVAITAPKIPDVDIDASIPKVAVELSSKEDLAAASVSDAKWKAPKFSLRKLGISGPKFKKGGEVDVKTLDAEGDSEIAIKGPKMKMPKFGIMFPKSKQDIEGGVDVKASKGRVDTSSGQVDVSSDVKVKIPSVKLPTVDISAPKLEVDIAVPKADTSSITDKPHEINIDIPDVKLNIPKFSMPKFGKSKGSDEDAEIEKAKVEAKVSPSKPVKAVEASSGELGAEAKGKSKELKMKMPAIKMPSFGISRKDADVSETKLEISSSEDKAKKVKTAAQEAKVLLEGDGKTSFIKMPTFKMSPPKVKAKEVDLTVKGSRENIQLPDVHVKVPQVALPSFGIKSDQTADVTFSKAEAKKSVGLESAEAQFSDKLKMPSLEISAPTQVPSLQISVPCVKPDICTSFPKAEVDVSDVDIKHYEGDLKIPKLPSIDVSVPDLEFDFGLPKPSAEISLEHETALSLERNAAKLKMPRVELTNFGESEAKMEISGDKSKLAESEMKLKGSKIKMPHFDISLPKVRLDEEDIPFIEGEMKMHGSSAEVSTTEGIFSLPSVELPKMSTPKIRAPELELDISLNKDDAKDSEKAELSYPEGDQHELKLKMPKIKMPKFGGSSTVVKDTAKVDVKAYKTEDSSDSGIRGFRIKMPKLQVGSLKRGGEDVETESDHKMSVKGDVKVSGHEESENGRMFKIKMPSFGISSKTIDVSTEPLHPSGEGAEKFKMPKISLPDVGFSGVEGEGLVESGQASATDKTKSAKSSSIENLEIDVGLKMPKIKMPTIGLIGRKADDDMEVSLEDDSEGKKSLFKMPDVELSTPKIKGHAEYEVDGAQLEHRLSKDMEGNDSTRKTSKIKDEHKHHGTTGEDAERKYKVKLPKFAVGLPKAMSGEVELSAPNLKLEAKDSEINMKQLSSEHDSDHEGKKMKKNIFSLGKVKDKSSSLFSSDADTSLETEGPEVKVKLPKIKMKPSFGRSRGKGKGTEVNGEFEASTRTDGDADRSLDDTSKSSKIKFPRLGFSSSKANSGEVNGTNSSGHVNGENEISIQNGSQDGAVKVGKLKFPKVEFSSPYKGKEIDSEMNLKLVKTDEPETREESNESSFTSKFKSPKITFSGFKKKEKGEDHLVSSSARTEMATMENVGEGDSKSAKGRISLGFLSSKSKGEYRVDNSGIQKEVEGDNSKDKSTKYKMPKLSLSTKSGTEVETTTETHTDIQEGSQEGFQISLPQVCFTTHQEEETIKEEETTLGFLKVTTTKQIKTETVTEKTLAI